MNALNGRPRLESWKEIAGYLQRTVRTVQRWEENEGLPVHRQVHQSLGNIHAYPDELDNWIAQRKASPQSTPSGEESAKRTSRRWLIAGAAVLSVGLIAGTWVLSNRFARHVEPAWLLLTALDNRSGEPLLDESVPFLLEREISNWPDVYVAPRARVEDTLVLMRKNRDARIDAALGRELAIRDGRIRLVVSSRAERVQSVYLFSVGVTEVSSGRLVGGTTEQARTLQEVPAALRRLASAIRRTAGSSDASVGSRMERVTTPSLRACQLYSQSETAIGHGDPVLAEQLARAAIAEDPLFAEAHLCVANMLWLRRRPAAEWRPYLARAVALSETATDRERRTILAHQKLLEGDEEGALASYHSLLETYPDDRNARNHMIVIMERTGRAAEAAREIYRWADEISPNAPVFQVRAMKRALSFGDVERARKYCDRTLRVVQVNPDVLDQISIHFAGTFRLHDLWMAGKLDELRGELNRMVQSPVLNAFDASTAASFYEALGRLQDADAAIEKGPNKAEQRALLSYLRDDRDGLLRNLSSIPGSELLQVLTTPLLQVQAQWDVARIKTISTDQKTFPVYGDPLGLMCQLRLAALQGNRQTMAQRLTDLNRQPPIILGYRESFIARAAVAWANEQLGDRAGALGVLQKDDIGRANLFQPAGDSSAALWHRIRYEEARVLRDDGRQKEADQIEVGLRRDLRLADPDHPILVRLNRRDRTPLNVH